MELIREAREKKGLTQKELADLLGISVRTIQAIEQGQRKPGQILTIKLFKVLKIPISKLEFFLQQYTTN
ncbi:MAG: helix-turn-helix transcriptional regulator [Clostridia bacterium]|nr:helix-turn-helix transcriptional regulator [Clostridia bacterium]